MGLAPEMEITWLGHTFIQLHPHFRVIPRSLAAMSATPQVQDHMLGHILELRQKPVP